VAIMLAGPNGAGKTTTALSLFRDRLAGIEFVNADIIAQGLSGAHADAVAFEAGGIMLRRLHALADKRDNFAFETTGASRSFAPWLKVLANSGYQVHVYFFWLPSAETAIARVAGRVRSGGHHVPEDRIRTRYESGLRNFFRLYLPIPSIWQLIDNESVARQIAEGGRGLETTIRDAILWKELSLRYAQ
jgi:predicted ABC-type ATPase